MNSENLWKKIKNYKTVAIVEALSVYVGLTAIDAMVYNTSFFDIALNSFPRSSAYAVLGGLVGIRSYLKSIKD